MPWRSMQLAAQPLSRVPASKRGEVLIMQRMGFTKGDLTASEAEALDELFPAVRSRQPRGRKSTS